MKYDDIKTIADAIEFYKSENSQKAIETIQNNRDVNYLNNNFAMALCLTDVMLRNATRQICILAGDNIFKLLNILQNPFTLCYNAIQDKSNIRILAMGTTAQLDPDNSESYLKFKKVFKDIEIKRKVIQDPLKVRHYIICDNDVRIEDAHFPVGLSSSANRIHATVYFNAKPADVDLLKTKFAQSIESADIL